MSNELSNELDNVLWVEDMIQQISRHGSDIPLTNMLCHIRNIVPSKFNLMMAKLEHLLALELRTWDESEQQELKDTFEPNLKYQIHRFERMTNIVWDGKYTFGFSFGSFVLVNCKLLQNDPTFSTDLQIESLQEFNSLFEHYSQDVDHPIMFNSCEVFAFPLQKLINNDVNPDAKPNIDNELSRIRTIMFHLKCACATPFPNIVVGPMRRFVDWTKNYHLFVSNCKP